MIQADELVSVSVIVTGEGFNEIGDSLARLSVPIFLHVNLTEGMPLVRDDKSSIINENGSFYPQNKFIIRSIIGKTQRKHAERELRAQFELLSQKCKVVGIDSHQHAHAFEPLASLVKELAAEKSLLMRSYKEVDAHSFGAKTVRFLYHIAGVLSARLRNPPSWNQVGWKRFMMRSWEKLPRDYNGVTVVHPGTNFDAHGGFIKQVLRHARYIKS